MKIKNILLRNYIKDVKKLKKPTNIEKHLRLVIKIAVQYSRVWPMFEVMDLVQEGNIGLMTGIKKFDPDKKVKFSTYISYWIKAYIYNFIMWNTTSIKLTNTKAHRKIFNNLSKEKRKLESKGLEFNVAEIAEKLKVSEQDIFDLDALLKPGNTLQIEKQKILDEQTPEYILLHNERRNQINNIIDAFRVTLTPMQKYIFTNRILREHPATLNECAHICCTTKQNIHRIERNLMKAARDFFDVKELKRIFYDED